jgi:hypothetical protein
LKDELAAVQGKLDALNKESSDDDWFIQLLFFFYKLSIYSKYLSEYGFCLPPNIWIL